MLTPFNEACKLILVQLTKIRCFRAFKFSINNRMEMFSLDRMWMSRRRVTLEKNNGPTTQHMVENRSPSLRFTFFTQISLYHHHHHHHHLFLIHHLSIIYHLSIHLSFYLHTQTGSLHNCSTAAQNKNTESFSKLWEFQGGDPRALNQWWGPAKHGPGGTTQITNVWT